MDYFPADLGSMHDGQGEIFHQNMKEMETSIRDLFSLIQTNGKYLTKRLINKL